MFGIINIQIAFFEFFFSKPFERIGCYLKISNGIFFRFAVMVFKTALLINKPVIDAEWYIQAFSHVFHIKKVIHGNLIQISQLCSFGLYIFFNIFF